MRPTVSVYPPAPYGTMNVMGRLGHASCACTSAGAQAPTYANPSAILRRRTAKSTEKPRIHRHPPRSCQRDEASLPPNSSAY